MSGMGTASQLSICMLLAMLMAEAEPVSNFSGRASSLKAKAYCWHMQRQGFHAILV